MDAVIGLAALLLIGLLITKAGDLFRTGANKVLQSGTIQRSKQTIDKNTMITVDNPPAALFDSFIAATGETKWPSACRIEIRSRSDSDLAVALTNPIAGDQFVYVITTKTPDSGRTYATGTLARWQTSDGVPVRMQQAEEFHAILSRLGRVAS